MWVRFQNLEIQKYVTGLRLLALRACCFSRSGNLENKCFQKFITLVKMWLCQTNPPSRCVVFFFQILIGTSRWNSVNMARNNALKSVKFPILKGICEDKACKVMEFYRFVWWGTSLCPHHKNICKILHPCGTIPSLHLDKSSFNLVSYLILRHSFQHCWWIYTLTAVY